jgi:hypothetical protein
LDKWTHIAPMKNRRSVKCKNFKMLIYRAGAGVAVIGQYLYVIGGFDDDSPLRYIFWQYCCKIPKFSAPASATASRRMPGLKSLRSPVQEVLILLLKNIQQNHRRSWSGLNGRTNIRNWRTR